MATENIGPAARYADIAKRQLQQARGAHDRVADRVLGLAHAPNYRGRPVFRQRFGRLVDFRLRHAASLFHLVRGPLHHLVPDLVHAVHAVIDVLLVFPAVLEDVVHHPVQEGDIGAGTDTDVMIGLGRRAGVAWIDDDHLAAGFLRMQNVQHRYRMRFRSIGADKHGRLRVLNIVVAVRHRAITPGIGDAGHRGRVADARLVVAVIAAEEGGELAQQRRLFVVVLGGADPEYGVRPVGLFDVHQFGGDFSQRLVPADALVLAIDQFHRIFQPVFAVAVFAHRRAFRAMRAEVDR